MNIHFVSKCLTDNSLKVTPQRLAVLDAIITLKNHPTSEMILEYIRKRHPHVSVATVYKVLDVLTEKKIIVRVKTDKDNMRYDADLEKHHHIYCSDCDLIEDYKDEQLNTLLSNYFEEHSIPGFRIEDIRLQLIGTYASHEKIN